MNRSITPPLTSSSVNGHSPSANADAQLAIIQALLDQNSVLLNMFKANMQQCKVMENTELLIRLRDNIQTCVSHISLMGGHMSQMPPLPVQLNVDLANKFLPPRSMPAFSPMGMPPIPFPPGVGVGLGVGNAMMQPTTIPLGIPPSASGLLGSQQHSNGAVPSMLVPPPTVSQGVPQGPHSSNAAQGISMVAASTGQIATHAAPTMISAALPLQGATAQK
ncbi:hypothetical protein CEUSTIGMA_g11325.t1 [Chlamydomonas eustigma]|uniref:Uncharacterized protein n=1 Tax=Chlamydomonas eustigma TaxID=1157962 RepID=A0A250XLC0_9CHLO|nr:hypothetical protein CEUSTIGMA_g11325.t1 [Chlamydomonas eustigma]|eukprot:GAX83901.1 hypothetical protein CEUSTIGMA_g11325.t1 [Chlamydomonas eustigma]